MENIQRDLEKELAGFSSPKPSRKKKRWTLVFIGDHGKTISIKGFKGYAYLFMLILFAAVLSSAGFYYLYRENERASKKLERDLSVVRDQIISIRKEKDVLMARLVVAESSLKMIAGREAHRPAPKTAQKLPLKPSAKTKPEKPPLPKVKPEKAAVPKAKPEKSPAPAAKPEKPSLPKAKSEKSPQKKQQPPAKVALKPKVDETKAQVSPFLEAPAAVSIENLKVFYELNNKTFRAQFVLRNTNYDSEPIAGYTAIVLRGSGMGTDEGLVLPKLKLVSGRPAGHKRGQYFAIARFKMVRFKMIHQSDPKTYDAATIFVFDAKKNLLLERNFPIRIELVSAIVNE